MKTRLIVALNGISLESLNENIAADCLPGAVRFYRTLIRGMA